MTIRTIPIDCKPLFRLLHQKLIELLNSLEAADWHRPTVAKQWRVKDVVSHILDGQLRVLSIQRDRYFGESGPPSGEYRDIVNWLNGLNADWVKASKRLSPKVLVLLLTAIGDLVASHYESLDPWAEAIFPVNWAGEEQSYNWMHLAREYTEYWHHQQQVRDAVNQHGIMDSDFFYPLMDTFFQALPHTFKDVSAADGAVVAATITSDAGGTWYLQKEQAGWQLVKDMDSSPVASVAIPPEVAWKLFSKSKRPNEIIGEVQITGDNSLALRVLEMVSVMA